MYPDRVLSGMRPTGAMHLGHFHGVLKNWLKIQHEHECLFMVADWHALTTHYDDPQVIESNVWDMVIDWLAAGVDPNQATLFIQSRVPEHAELNLLLSMMTPLGWLERVPTYKEQRPFYLWVFGLPVTASGGYFNLSCQPCAGGRRPSAAH